MQPQTLFPQPKFGFVPVGTGGGACKFAGFLGAGGGGGFLAIEAVSSVGEGDTTGCGTVEGYCADCGGDVYA